MPKPINHPFEAGRVRTIELILSVTLANVCPGSITGGGCVSMVLYGSFMLPQGLKPLL